MKLSIKPLNNVKKYLDETTEILAEFMDLMKEKEVDVGFQKFIQLHLRLNINLTKEFLKLAVHPKNTYKDDEKLEQYIEQYNAMTGACLFIIKTSVTKELVVSSELIDLLKPISLESLQNEVRTDILENND